MATLPLDQIADCAFPLFAVNATSKNVVFTAGGGGSSKTGVPNGLAVCDWDGKSLKTRFIHKTGDSAVYDLAVHPEEEDQFVCIEGDECKAYTLKQPDCKEVQPLEGWKMGTIPKSDDESPVRLVRFNVKGDILATGTDKGQLLLWKYPSMKLMWSHHHHKDQINDLTFDNSGSMVATTSSDGTCLVINVADGEVAKKLDHGCIADVKVQIARDARKPRVMPKLKFRGVRFSADSKSLFTGLTAASTVAYLVKWELAGWALEKKTVACPSSHTAMAMSKDGQFISMATGNGEVFLFDALSPGLSKVSRVVQHDLFITSMSLTHKEGHHPVAFTVSADKTCRAGVLEPKSSNAMTYYFFAVLMVLIAMIMSTYMKANPEELQAEVTQLVEEAASTVQEGATQLLEEGK